MLDPGKRGDYDIRLGYRGWRSRCRRLLIMQAGGMNDKGREFRLEKSEFPAL
ncbi:hypothetical protein GCM10027278_17610 [Paralcaligenes ginsengisoli]